MTTSFRSVAQAQLDALQREPGVRGAVLVSRDGLAMLHGGRVGDAGMLAAMSATMLGAAEMAVPDPGLVRLSILAENVRLVAVPATGDTLLVVLAEPSADGDEILGFATAAGDAIAAATTSAVRAPASGLIGWMGEAKTRPPTQ